jgi:propionyl-CoA:succinyl-CoA transferase
VETDEPDESSAFGEPNACTQAVGDNVAEFLVREMRAGRIPKAFLPLQSGVGDIANCVLAALGAHPEIPPFEMYTEVLQDSVRLLETERCLFASTCALTLSPDKMDYVGRNMSFFPYTQKGRDGKRRS